MPLESTILLLFPIELSKYIIFMLILFYIVIKCMDGELSFFFDILKSNEYTFTCLRTKEAILD